MVLIDHPKSVRLPLPPDCCAKARWLLADGVVQPGDRLEFCRGEVICLSGLARTFAGLMVRDAPSGDGPRHVRYDPRSAQRLAALRL